MSNQQMNISSQEEHPQQQDQQRAATLQHVDDAVLPFVPTFPAGDHRMRLTDQELLVAKLIKAAVALMPEVEQLSDFMYGQFAIVALLQGETNAANIVEKIENLQAVREEHQISDTYQQGQNMLSRMVLDITPGFHLCFSYCSQENAYISVADYTKFDASILGNDEKANIWMAGEYYRKHACYPDFESIRKGNITLVECQDYDWKNGSMMNVNAARKMASELGANYPIHFRAVKHYHTGMFVNLLVSTFKRMVPSLVHNSLEVGCRFEAGRLDDFFQVPNAEASNQRLVASLQKALRHRYQNEVSFSLV